MRAHTAHLARLICTLHGRGGSGMAGRKGRPKKDGKGKQHLRTCQHGNLQHPQSIGIDSAPPFLRSTSGTRGRPLLVEASLWTRCVRALEAELPEQQFNTWVRPLQALERAGALKLLAPNRFAVDWINANLLERIGELLREGAEGDVPIVTVEVGSRNGNAVTSSTLAPVVPTSTKARRPEGLVVGARINPDFTFASFV